MCIPCLGSSFESLSGSNIVTVFISRNGLMASPKPWAIEWRILGIKVKVTTRNLFLLY